MLASNIRTLLLIACVAVAGCSTGAQREYNRIGNVISDEQKKYNECYEAAEKNPKIAPIRSKLPGPDGISLLQLADKSYITKKQRNALLAYSQLTTPCRKIALTTANATTPLIMPVLSKGFAEQDEVYLKLIEGKISWGQATKQLKAANDRQVAEELRIMNLYKQDYQRAHTMEMEQRQAAASQLSKALSSIKPIETKIPQPIRQNRIDCTSRRVGDTVETECR